MNKILLILVLLSTSILPLLSQESPREILNIMNSTYGKNQKVLVINPTYKDLFNSQTQEYFANAIKQTIISGGMVSDMHDISAMDKPKSKSDFEGELRVFYSDATYVVNWDIQKLDFISHKIKGKQKTRIVLSSIVTITDLVTGIIVVAKQVNYNNDIDGFYSEYYTDKNFSGLRKVLKKSITQAIRSKMPIYKEIKSLHETKKDKAKSVILISPNKSFQKWSLHVHIIEKEIIKNGKTIYIMKTIGQIRHSKKATYPEHIYKVKKGKKEILKAFNDGKKLYCSHYK